MKDPVTLTQTRFAGGIWEGILTGPAGATPLIEARHEASVLEGVEVTALPDGRGQVVRVPIPAALIGDGVRSILVLVDGEVLGRITLLAGAPLEDDLLAEIGLLRAELDLLKRAFRRHCAETQG